MINKIKYFKVKLNEIKKMEFTANLKLNLI